VSGHRLRTLLDELGIHAGQVVYAHTSFSRLAHLEVTPLGLIDALVEHLGPDGTLVMPSFAWHLDKSARPWKGYADYYRERPVFDVRHTPANIGVVPELFRTYYGTERSAHYWWSVTACGPLAATVTRDQHAVVEPYGPESAFGRLHAADAIILGLGVTLNTTSLAPVVDHELGLRHTQVLFSDTVQEGVVIDHRGQRLVTRSLWLLPEVVRNIKPSAVFSQSAALRAVLRRADRGDVIQFAYPFKAYFAAGIELGLEASTRGDRMPWLADYDLTRTAHAAGMAS
jgi:aminoglycoside N3'-acetyltransferase